MSINCLINSWMTEAQPATFCVVFSDSHIAVSGCKKYSEWPSLQAFKPYKCLLQYSPLMPSCICIRFASQH